MDLGQTFKKVNDFFIKVLLVLGIKTQFKYVKFSIVFSKFPYLSNGKQYFQLISTVSYMYSS